MPPAIPYIYKYILKKYYIISADDISLYIVVKYPILSCELINAD